MTRIAPILTFDIEEWFHLLECPSVPGVEGWGKLESRVEQSTDCLLELLARHQLTATFFVLGWVAERYPALLRRIAQFGHEIGCHSHVHSLVHRQTPDEFREETRHALEAISVAVSAPVRLYRAPGFSLTRDCAWAFEVLAELGFEIDCSVFPGTHAHGGSAGAFPGAPFRIEASGRILHEFPASLVRVGPLHLAFAGGGYFRLLPIGVISRLAARSPYTMTYFHPRDFDAGQPRISGLSRRRAFRAYVGIEGALRKLDRLLTELGGQSVGAADRTFDWERSPVVRVGAGLSKVV